MTFRSLLGRERNVIDYQVHQTSHGAAIRVRVSGAVDLDTLAQRLAASLARVGVPDPQVTIERVEGFERQASGKLKRFFAFSPP